ncbi:MAG: hypothetical protein E7423_10795 [Ruminococcaceae bacterium]|nr:hypothetical protein [Oscillospiraceae bacterium]
MSLLMALALVPAPARAAETETPAVEARGETSIGSVTLPTLENMGAQVFTMSDDFTDIRFTGDRPIFKGVPANEVKDVTAVLTAWYPAAWGDKDPTVWKFDATIRWQAY